MKNKNKWMLATNLVIVLVLATFATLAVAATTRTTPAFAPMRKGSAAKTVAITVNVYLGSDCVRQMADYLATNNVPATFFLGGCWVVKNVEIAQKLVQYGFCIGSHGYSHLDHSTLSYAQNLTELNKARDAIAGACGADVRLFAPPSGAYNEATLQAAKDLGYTVVMWSKDAIDWRDQEVDSIVSRTTRDKGDGEILLLHPTDATVAALPAIVDSYLADGYRFVTVADMLPQDA